MSTISLTASENFTSKPVRLAHGARMGSFYEFNPPVEGKPGEWFFPSSEVPAKLIRKVSVSAKSLFNIELFDWRPNSGSAAEDAVMLGVCRSKGDALIHFSHSQGGHFAIEPLAERIGVKCFHLPVDNRTLLIDIPKLESILAENSEIKLVMLDQSFKLRMQHLVEIKKILPTGVVFAYDCSHDGGLIAGEELQQPIRNGVDILFGNTHKTIFGPQKAFIGWANPLHWSVESISQAIVPTLQSNCHTECLLPMLLCFKELEMFGREYAKQVIKNARAFAMTLQSEGFTVSGESFGYTETQQVHVVIGSPDKALQTTQKLHKIGIRTNNIEIPGQRGNHGLRLGTQAMTRCGMKEQDFEELARLMKKHYFDEVSDDVVRHSVEELNKQFPRFPLAYSFDCYMNDQWMINLLNEIAK